MTPIGHTLTGLAIGYAAVPISYSARQKAVALGVVALLANAPDLPLPNWGHARYDVSHSVFVTTACVATASILAGLLQRRTQLINTSLIFAGAAAWYSHLLLDTFYNHGKGLAMFWPVSKSRVALPIPFFATMTVSPLISSHNFAVFAIEGASYGAVVLLVLLLRSRTAAAHHGPT